MGPFEQQPPKEEARASTTRQRSINSYSGALEIYNNEFTTFNPKRELTRTRLRHSAWLPFSPSWFLMIPYHEATRHLEKYRFDSKPSPAWCFRTPCRQLDARAGGQSVAAVI